MIGYPVLWNFAFWQDRLTAVRIGTHNTSNIIVRLLGMIHRERIPWYTSGFE